MTYAAELAKEVAYRMEGKKDALRQTQENGVKVTFSIHPQDMHPALYSDPMGQRYVIVIVPIDDNEQPKQNESVPAAPASTHSSSSEVATDSKRTWDQLSYTERANKLIYNPDFHEFAGITPDQALDYVRGQCGVKSRTDILPDTEHARALDTLNKAFRDWQFEQRYT